MEQEKVKKKSRAVKVVCIVLGVILGLAAVFLVGGRMLFNEEFTIIDTIEKVSSKYPIYSMDVEGNYHFDEFLERGGASSDAEVSVYLTELISHGFYKVKAENTGVGCSVLSALKPDGGHVWGRNFDWTEAAAIIVRSYPDEGYASISTCDFSNLTGDGSAVPEGIGNEMLAVAALYIPMDGMNEVGLCVADLEVNEGGMIDVDTEKPDLTITTALRLILNKAATVDEAVEMLARYDIHASGGISHHIAISDASDRSVVLEFVDGETVIVETPYVTNFNMANGNKAAGGEWSQERFRRLEALYEENAGKFTKEQVRDALSSVAKKQDSKWLTQWSIVYDGIEKKAAYYFRADYTEALEIGMER